MQYAKLWKRILNEGLCRKVNSQYAEIAEPLIVTATIIVDSRPFVEGQCYRPAGKSLAIPAENLWIEFPNTRPGDKPGDPDKPNAEGCLFVSKRTDAGWDIESYSVSETRDYGVVVFGKREWTMDLAGHPAINRTVHTSDLWADPSIAVKNTDRICFVACETLELLGCKNVSLKPNDGEPKQVRRAIKRHGGTPDKYRYHTLVVRPPGAKSDSPSQEIGIMPRHVCRGHFAEYGPEFNKGLLFGKYAGRFYIPPHMKGKKENGTVEKDYLVPA